MVVVVVMGALLLLLQLLEWLGAYIPKEEEKPLWVLEVTVLMLWERVWELLADGGVGVMAGVWTNAGEDVRFTPSAAELLPQTPEIVVVVVVVVGGMARVGGEWSGPSLVLGRCGGYEWVVKKAPLVLAEGGDGDPMIQLLLLPLVLQGGGVVLPV